LPSKQIFMVISYLTYDLLDVYLQIFEMVALESTFNNVILLNAITA
jgi:hypothetical protein